MHPALLTDRYELEMVASYLRRSMTQPATFSLVVRDLPPERGFLVAAGLEDCLAELEAFGFAEDELEWLAGQGFDAGAVEGFGRLRFTGDVHAVPEGRIVLAGEPVLEVTAPLPEAQVVETLVLNRVTHQMTVASKAARCVLAADGIEVVDFSLRRTPGPEAAMAVARACAIAGFAGTSNVEAARRLGIPASGTMAHSYVEAYPSEIDAFRAFARDATGPVTFLVDTYDTPTGVDRAIAVAHELGLGPPLAVRIDSGDLAALAVQTRRQLDEAGLGFARIVVSGGLDEHDLDRMRRAGVPIDVAGIGTRLGVSADAPTLDTVYKLVAVGDRPVLKLSAGKGSLPGAKQVWRRRPIGPDVLGLRDEVGPAGTEPLLEPVMREGVRLRPAPGWAEARRRLEADLEALGEPARRLAEPAAPAVAVSSRLRVLTDTVMAGVAPRS